MPRNRRREKRLAACGEKHANVQKDCRWLVLLIIQTRHPFREWGGPRGVTQAGNTVVLVV